MPQTKSPSGPETYRYGNQQIEILPYFLYEVSLYKIEHYLSNILVSRLYTSNKPLKIDEVKEVKKTKNFKVVRFITLLGAPKNFIEEEHLPIYKLYKNEKRKNRNSS